ncbi:MAG: ATP-binding cassette domain-containing protein [Clostridia bacterium]|nr:ATP-binding cassette domain-containing protein [Clostridia bacterium]
MLEKVGIGHLKARRINQLSGGQCQLVAVARAIVMQPPLILADEPTGSLDSDSAKHLMEIFSNLNKQGQTIIMVTHNMDLCKWCSRNIKISDGMIE